MKKLLLLIAVLVSFTAVSQDSLPKLQLAAEGVPPIVVLVEGMTAADIYKKTLNWIQEGYKNPKEVLKADIPNENVRINGYKGRAWGYKAPIVGMTYFDMEYTFEVEIKDNKVRLTFTPGQFWTGSQKAQFTYRTFFKDDGTIKKVYADAKPTMEESMNNLVSDYYNYIKGATKKADW